MEIHGFIVFCEKEQMRRQNKNILTSDWAQTSSHSSLKKYIFERGVTIEKNKTLIFFWFSQFSVKKNVIDGRIDLHVIKTSIIGEKV